MDSPAQTMKEASAQTMKEAALKFIENVKQGFNNPEDEKHKKYNQFAYVLDDFFQGRISAEVLVTVMESLFEGHPNLVSEFKIFLPENNQETLSVTNFREKGEISVTESVRQTCSEFTCKVKDRFMDNFEVYTSFLEIMIHYGKGMLNICEVYGKTYELFFGHADLICEFESFLTDQDEKVRQENEKIRGFITEDQLHEVDIRLSNLESITAILEGKMPDGGPEDERSSTDLNFGRIKTLHGDYFSTCVEEVLTNNPTRGTFPLDFPLLEQKKEELDKIKDSYFNFVKECHGLRGRLR